MKGITFGNSHSLEDFKLILTSKEIGSPSVKERKIEIEGADGFLDFGGSFFFLAKQTAKLGDSDCR